ncbi:glutamate 5-kinase [Synechococcus sp. CS-1325]|uniref:glutamate 5-kinase n=1 Tax=unclassified Synechococcus TaxID=2626047 RepID=UPI000DB5E346|nr:MULTISPECIES: glutamate 5-kinase [unclassified Synechococcus]PZV00306.1 MAG: glutamate 5-kinase [Cyanobium sp.]MCT0199665.1 glutamate 5-kinase [Synechococcus sp. CS-1325]MCT0213352.1 glutamate 5-kinase [Synechococcus sp. CS-1326]MCT0231589.1 glutamate 5-kinase [Synechococcus sp. CS-1324]MCT0232794.1 glutamate 5-kinase [Synechococcus sp. CS-1327]
MSFRRVIKVGTSLLRGTAGRDTAQVIDGLAESLSRQRRCGEAITLVTSGAVGLGCHALKLAQRPGEVVALQAAAAIGQGRLMGFYEASFARHGETVAQVLLTRGDLASRRRYQNACRTLEQLLSWGVVPVVNENDTLATDELRFGDNDTLSALVAVAIGADELVLLTDVDHLYSGDPRSDATAEPIEEVRDLIELARLSGVASGGGRWGTGGMTTKLTAARIATSSGVRVRLADGRDPAVLDALLAGERLGTVFQPSSTPLPDRKGWLAHALIPRGNLIIDAGAERALLERGASLLAVGIQRVEGSFGRRDAVRLLSLQGEEIGRGLTALSSDELRKVQGLSSEAAQRALGQPSGDAVVHRDHLVLTAAAAILP